MSSKRQSGQRGGASTARKLLPDDNIEVGRDDDSEIEIEDISDQPTAEKQQDELPERKKSPAYVAPIPVIRSIPRISPTVPLSAQRPKLPPFVGSFLVGKTVDESGDIIDDKTGQVLARAGGDLPEIIGRKVSNNQGDILGDNGELLGYVADIEIERKGSTSPQSPGSMTGAPRSLFEMMGRRTSSLMVDHLGNILDANGEVVGKFLDNNNPLHRKEKEDEQLREEIQRRAAEGPFSSKKKKKQPQPEPEPERPEMVVEEEEEQEEQQPPPPPKSPEREKRRSQSQPPPATSEQPRPRRTEDERRQNAEAWRKEKPGESPSDIFLDVKSTREGIQLTIRIPTVFGGQQLKPNISFS
ncbi:hypothetical protein QBC35DRAFT_447735 [Podospora australis]|uniref:Uncharacterized protein n=1 Tax=Podospora australis TaxID=1536484 RepID=A0AAN6X4I3_9PEZI|nr:hypothetical protein QBC35DRAFT_447735 [Podospora australis]